MPTFHPSTDDRFFALAEIHAPGENTYHELLGLFVRDGMPSSQAWCTTKLYWQDEAEGRWIAVVGNYDMNEEKAWVDFRQRINDACRTR
jgi:hypothetical protein